MYSGQKEYLYFTFIHFLTSFSYDFFVELESNNIYDMNIFYRSKYEMSKYEIVTH